MQIVPNRLGAQLNCSGPNLLRTPVGAKKESFAKRYIVHELHLMNMILFLSDRQKQDHVNLICCFQQLVSITSSYKYIVYHVINFCERSKDTDLQCTEP